MSAGHEQDVEGQCLGKERFASPVLANKIARRRHDPRLVYRCPHCGGWHIGNPARRRRFARKRAPRTVQLM